MRVIFAIPAMTGTLHVQCVLSLMQAQRMLDLKGIPHELFTISNCSNVVAARDTLAGMFLRNPENTDLFLLDYDVGFDARAVLAILERPEEIVAGVYPLKRDSGGFPVQIRTEDGVPLGRDGLIEAELAPAGFMRIKRSVFEKMQAAHPELRYEKSVVFVDGEPLDGAYDFFGMGIYQGQFRGEDYAFCQRWRDMGGQVWVYPDIDFEHVGTKVYRANFHEHLLRLPGGAKSDLRLEKARQIFGWMTEPELVWLAQQACFHQCIVEIGSFLGRSTRALADNTPGKVWALDDWKGPRDFSEFPVELQAGLYPAFLENVGDLVRADKLVPVQIDHAQVQSVDLPPPDMVFLDGHHSYEATKRDIGHWREHMSEGGLLCGHDYNWETVKQAVDELLPGAEAVPGTAIWSYKTP